MSTNRPHTAIINIQLEVHSLLDSGECSGQVLRADVLEKAGITPAFNLAVSGHTMEACLKNLKAKLEKLKDEHDG